MIKRKIMAEREILKWVTIRGHRVPIYMKTVVNTSSVNKALDSLKNFKLVDDINIPVAIEYNKKYFIVDGNHRVVATKLLGIDKVKIRVMNK